jgi:hypothetical protein
LLLLLLLLLLLFGFSNVVVVDVAVTREGASSSSSSRVAAKAAKSLSLAVCEEGREVDVEDGTRERLGRDDAQADTDDRLPKANTANTLRERACAALECLIVWVGRSVGR